MVTHGQRRGPARKQWQNQERFNKYIESRFRSRVDKMFNKKQPF